MATGDTRHTNFRRKPTCWPLPTTLRPLRQQTRTARLMAIFGGKNPHLQSMTLGGVTCATDLSPDRIAEFKYLWKETMDFVDNVYIPDLLAIAGFYKDWGKIGGTQ